MGKLCKLGAEIKNKKEEIVELVKNFLKELEEKLKVFNFDLDILQLEFAENDDIKCNEELVLVYDHKTRNIMIKHYHITEKKVIDVTFSNVYSELYYEEFKGLKIDDFNFHIANVIAEEIDQIVPTMLLNLETRYKKLRNILESMF